MLCVKVTHKSAHLLWLMLDKVELNVKGFTQPCLTWNLNNQPSEPPQQHCNTLELSQLLLTLN